MVVAIRHIINPTRYQLLNKLPLWVPSILLNDLLGEISLAIIERLLGYELVNAGVNQRNTIRNYMWLHQRSLHQTPKS